MQVSRQPSENNLEIPAPEPLVEVRRGGITESRHRGHIVGVTPDGEIVALAGSPETVTYLRSSAKPHQAIPLIASGAADRYGFNEREIALACASHSGEKIHVDVARSMLSKIGLAPDALSVACMSPSVSKLLLNSKQMARNPTLYTTTAQGNTRGCWRWHCISVRQSKPIINLTTRYRWRSARWFLSSRASPLRTWPWVWMAAAYRSSVSLSKPWH